MTLLDLDRAADGFYKAFGRSPEAFLMHPEMSRTLFGSRHDPRAEPQVYYANGVRVVFSRRCPKNTLYTLSELKLEPNLKDWYSGW
jgi:hypothetical protein